MASQATNKPTTVHKVFFLEGGDSPLRLWYLPPLIVGSRRAYTTDRLHTSNALESKITTVNLVETNLTRESQFENAAQMEPLFLPVYGVSRPIRNDSFAVMQRQTDEPGDYPQYHLRAGEHPIR